MNRDQRSNFRGLQEVGVEASPALPSFKIIGVGQIVQALVLANDFSNAAFDTITINSFDKVDSDDGVVYQGKLTIENDQGISVNALVTGNYDVAANRMVFSAAKYEIETTEEGQSDDGDNEPEVEVPTEENVEEESTTPDDGPTVDSDGYTLLDAEEAENDAQVTAAFHWGNEAVINKGYTQKKIPVSEYDLTEWTSAKYKKWNNGITYKFEALLLGANYVHLQEKFSVYMKYATQDFSLAAYWYRASNITKDSWNNGNNNDNSTDTGNNSTDTGNNSTNDTNTTVPTNPIAWPVGYTDLSQNDLANNQAANAALLWGVNALIQKGISQNKIPAASPDYSITHFIGAAFIKTSYGVKYLFYTNLTNALNYKVDANITITYTTSTKAYKLAGFSFNAHGYPLSAITPPGHANNNTTVDNSTVVVIPDNSTVVVDPTTPVVVPPVVDNSTVVVDPTTPVVEPPVVVTPTEPVAPVVTADGYTVYTADQLAQDPIAKAALQDGINSLIQKTLATGKIPAANPNYNILSLDLASYKKQVIGTSFKFQVNLINVDYVHVDANMTVFYRYSTKVNSLNGYAFKSYNYTKGTLL
jgi:hypothetical protein